MKLSSLYFRNNVSVNSKPDHPPGDPQGLAHSSCLWCRVFALLSCLEVLRSGGEVLNQNKSLIILKKGAIFALSLKQMGSNSFHMFIYARSEQCDLIGGPAYLLGPIYMRTNTQHIAVYPGKFKFILVKISQGSGCLHGRHAKENQTPVTFFTTGNLSGLLCLHECKYRAYQNLFSYAVHLPG